MSDRGNQPEHDGVPRDVEAEASGSSGDAPRNSASSIAAELVVHGLLATIQPRNREEKAARLERTLVALRTLDAHPRRVARRPLPRRVFRWSMSLAALGLITALAVFFVPGQQSAWATVQGSIDALRESGTRRYEIRMETWGTTNPFPNPVATIDTRSPDLFVVAHRPPWSKSIVHVGRDGSGLWAIGLDGDVVRENAHKYLPPWSVDGDSRVVDSLDRLLAQLSGKYSVQKLRPGAFEGSTMVCERVLATRNAGVRGPFPNVVEIWVDPDTKLTERVEFRWAKDIRAAEGREGENGPPKEPPTAREGGFDRGRWSRGRFDPFVSRDPRDAEVLRESLGELGFDLGRSWQRVPSFRDRSDGERGPAGAGGTREGPPPGPPGTQGSRGGRDGHHKGGWLKSIVFQRVQAPELADEWFTPEAHLDDGEQQ